MSPLNLKTGCLWVTAVGSADPGTGLWFRCADAGCGWCVSALIADAETLVVDLATAAICDVDWGLAILGQSCCAQRGWINAEQMKELTGYRWLLAIWLLLLEGLVESRCY